MKSKIYELIGRAVVFLIATVLANIATYNLLIYILDNMTVYM